MWENFKTCMKRVRMSSVSFRTCSTIRSSSGEIYLRLSVVITRIIHKIKCGLSRLGNGAKVLLWPQFHELALNLVTSSNWHRFDWPNAHFWLQYFWKKHRSSYIFSMAWNYLFGVQEVCKYLSTFVKIWTWCEVVWQLSLMLFWPLAVAQDLIKTLHIVSLICSLYLYIYNYSIPGQNNMQSCCWACLFDILMSETQEQTAGNAFHWISLADFGMWCVTVCQTPPLFVDLALHALNIKRKLSKDEIQWSLKSICIWQTSLFFLSEMLCFVDFPAGKTCCNTRSVLATAFKETITYPKMIFTSLSASCHNQFLQDFPRRTPTVKSKQSLVIWLLPFTVPCIYNCANRLTLCLISWRTQHATHIAAGSRAV